MAAPRRSASAGSRQVHRAAILHRECWSDGEAGKTEIHSEA
jgi:hypothetical protein